MHIFSSPKQIRTHFTKKEIVKPFLIEQQNDEDNDSDDDENTDNYSNRDADRLSAVWHRQHQTKCSEQLQLHINRQCEKRLFGRLH